MPPSGAREACRRRRPAEQTERSAAAAAAAIVASPAAEWSGEQRSRSWSREASRAERPLPPPSEWSAPVVTRCRGVFYLRSLGPEALKLQSAPGALPEYIRTAFDWQRNMMPGWAGSRADAVRQWCPGAEPDRRPWDGRLSGEHRGAADVLQTSRPDTASVLPPDEGRMPYAEAGDGRRGGSR